MPRTTIAALAAILAVGGAPMAYAQAGGGFKGGLKQQFDERGQVDQRGQFDRRGQVDPRSVEFGRGAQMEQQRTGATAQQQRFEEDRLRDVLRQAGFSQVRVLDAAYVVQARSPDGRTVLMYVDPPARTAATQPGQFRPGMQDRDRQARESGVTGALGADRPLDRRSDLRDMLPEHAARAIIQARGMTDIEDFTRQGDHYVATADWFGEEVDVRIDARSGRVLEPRSLERAQVRAKLQDEGWSDVRDIERDDNVFFARAERDDREYDLMLDANTGRLVDYRVRS